MGGCFSRKGSDVDNESTLLIPISEEANKLFCDALICLNDDYCELPQTEWYKNSAELVAYIFIAQACNLDHPGAIKFRDSQNAKINSLILSHQRLYKCEIPRY